MKNNLFLLILFLMLSGETHSTFALENTPSVKNIEEDLDAIWPDTKNTKKENYIEEDFENIWGAKKKYSRKPYPSSRRCSKYNK